MRFKDLEKMYMIDEYRISHFRDFIRSDDETIINSTYCNVTSYVIYTKDDVFVGKIELAQRPGEKRITLEVVWSAGQEPIRHRKRTRLLSCKIKFTTNQLHKFFRVSIKRLKIKQEDYEMGKRFCEIKDCYEVKSYDIFSGDDKKYKVFNYGILIGTIRFYPYDKTYKIPDGLVMEEGQYICYVHHAHNDNPNRFTHIETKYNLDLTIENIKLMVEKLGAEDESTLLQEFLL